MAIFQAADLLIPKKEYMKYWPVIACDQFTSQVEYWKQIKEYVADFPSTYHIIFPEAEFGITMMDKRIQSIPKIMEMYLSGNIFNEYKNSFVYVERTLHDNSVRKGLIGVIDLEEYDFSPDSQSRIRATEQTVMERIPPRKKIRRGAPLELSHVLLLCDDEQHTILETAELIKPDLPVLYDFDLMQQGGHITGYLVSGSYAVKIQNIIDDYCRIESQKFINIAPLLFAVGDGNHSLATAKACYEELKQNTSDLELLNRARYAMVELENIGDSSQKFEPIHRIISNVNVSKLLNYMERYCDSDAGYQVKWVSGKKAGVIVLNAAKGVLPIGILQNAIDEYLKNDNKGVLDYIHGEDVLRELAVKPDSIGFILPSIAKADFFKAIANDGVLPRKTFSMGEARDKRYYIEARKL